MEKHFSHKEILRAIQETKTMGEASIFLGVDRRTFKKYAEKHGLYNPKTSHNRVKIPLNDILGGKHPQYPTSKLSKRLVKEGLKKYMCECCNISSWQNKKISLELNHINGVSHDHSISNLELLCPNCHSQTLTYRSKKLTYGRSSR